MRASPLSINGSPSSSARASDPRGSAKRPDAHTWASKLLNNPHEREQRGIGRGLPRKGGAGGRGAVGAWSDQRQPASGVLDRGDPNASDSDEDEDGQQRRRSAEGEFDFDDVFEHESHVSPPSLPTVCVATPTECASSEAAVEHTALQEAISRRCTAACSHSASSSSQPRELISCADPAADDEPAADIILSPVKPSSSKPPATPAPAATPSHASTSLRSPAGPWQTPASAVSSSSSVPTTPATPAMHVETADPGGAGEDEAPITPIAPPQAVATEIRVLPRVSIDDFDLLATVGRGTFGKVLQVRKKDSSEIFAMKILKKRYLIEKGQVANTKAERNILKGVSRHPFISELYYAFQNDHKLYLVMKYCNGGELFHHLRREHMFSEELVRFYAAEIALALGHLHAANIIHRDLKPENVLLDEFGHVCLTDFGLAKADVADPNRGAASFCGTDEYMAPEIIAGKGHGKAVDWWSLGALIFEMLTGRPPWELKNNNLKKLHGEILSAKLKLPPYLSCEAKSLIKGLLNRDVSKRLGSGLADVQELQTHPFFKRVHWGRLQRREVEPPFVPPVSSPMDTSNFSTTFTSEAPADSPTEGPAPGFALADDPTADPFGSFTYVAPSYLEVAMRGVDTSRQQELLERLQAAETGPPAPALAALSSSCPRSSPLAASTPSPARAPGGAGGLVYPHLSCSLPHRLSVGPSPILVAPDGSPVPAHAAPWIEGRTSSVSAACARLHFPPFVAAAPSGS